MASGITFHDKREALDYVKKMQSEGFRSILRPKGKGEYVVVLVGQRGKFQPKTILAPLMSESDRRNASKIEAWTSDDSRQLAEVPQHIGEALEKAIRNSILKSKYVGFSNDGYGWRPSGGWDERDKAEYEFRNYPLKIDRGEERVLYDTEKQEVIAKRTPRARLSRRRFHAQIRGEFFGAASAPDTWVVHADTYPDLLRKLKELLKEFAENALNTRIEITDTETGHVEDISGAPLASPETFRR